MYSTNPHQELLQAIANLSDQQIPLVLQFISSLETSINNYPTSAKTVLERTLLKWENPNFLELILQLGWGQPQEATYKRGRPLAGSEFIHAVNPGCYPIG